MAGFDDLFLISNPVVIERNVIRHQGAYWQIRQHLSIDGVPVAWTTGFTAQSHVRTRAGVLVQDLYCSLFAGGIDLIADSNSTGSVTPGNYVYDLDVWKTAVPQAKLPLMAGTFTVTPQVTS